MRKTPMLVIAVSVAMLASWVTAQETSSDASVSELRNRHRQLRDQPDAAAFAGDALAHAERALAEAERRATTHDEQGTRRAVAIADAALILADRQIARGRQARMVAAAEALVPRLRAQIEATRAALEHARQDPADSAEGRLTQ